MGMPVKERCDVDQNTGEVVEDQPESADNIVIETENITSNRNNLIGELLVRDVVIGGEYDVLDKNSRWCEGSILKIDYEANRVYIGFLHWDSRFDEWVACKRLAPIHSHTYVNGGELKQGQRVEVLDKKGVWCEAFVVEERPTDVLIHYKGFSTNFDEWLDRCTERVRSFSKPNVLIMRRKEAKHWKIPGSSSSGSSGSGTYHTNEHLGDKRPRESVEEHKFSGNDENKRDVSSSGGTTGTDSRKRKIDIASIVYRHYLNALGAHSLEVVPVSGDGNCLFRSVAHQVYGDDALHELVRARCMDYMECEGSFFSQFVEGGAEAFPLYLAAKRVSGCWGDDPEIEAMCELYNRPAEIWAFDPALGAKKLRTFHETGSSASVISSPRPTMIGNNNNSSSSSSSSSNSVSSGNILAPSGSMRLSYYGGGHYDSIVDKGYSVQPLSIVPGVLEDLAIARSKERARQGGRRPAVEAEMLRETDALATEQTTLDLALQESRRCQVAADYDDLETCLALSLQQQQSGFATDGNIPTDSLAASSDLIAIQGDLLRSVREESEREFIERALISSLAEQTRGSGTTAEEEKDILEATRLVSEREFEESSARVMAASRAEHHGGQPSAEMTLALELSALSDEEVLQRALKQSREVARSPTVHSSSSSSSSSASVMTHSASLFAREEEELQRALNASMSGYSVPVLQPFDGGGEGGSFYVSNSGGLEEMDEELMRAIEESMRK